MASLAILAHSPTAQLPRIRALKTPSDEFLVVRAKDGDRNAFRMLVVRHQQSIARTVAGMLGPVMEVDDVVQEVFIRFYQTMARFRGDAACSTYLKRIAINLSLDTLRRRKRLAGRFVSRDDDGTYIPESMDESSDPEGFDRRRLVDQALASLRPHHRAVVVLRLVDGYSTKEAAEILGVPTGTVLSRLSRATAHLRTLLGPVLELES